LVPVKNWRAEVTRPTKVAAVTVAVVLVVLAAVLFPRVQAEPESWRLLAGLPVGCLCVVLGAVIVTRPPRRLVKGVEADFSMSKPRDIRSAKRLVLDQLDVSKRRWGRQKGRRGVGLVLSAAMGIAATITPFVWAAIDSRTVPASNIQVNSLLADNCGGTFDASRLTIKLDDGMSAVNPQYATPHVDCHKPETDDFLAATKIDMGSAGQAVVLVVPRKLPVNAIGGQVAGWDELMGKPGSMSLWFHLKPADADDVALAVQYDPKKGGSASAIADLLSGISVKGVK